MKKRILIGVIALAVFTVAILVVWQVVKKRNRLPQVISDLVSGKYKKIETRVYVCENGIMTPYVVLDTDNYGDAVLLMRDFAYPQEMMYRDENMYGAGGAYYSGSIVDDFLEKTFYNYFSDGLRGIIRESEFKIFTQEYVSAHEVAEGPAMETIRRHVFSLSKMEWGSNLLALKKDDPCYEADAIKGIQKYAYKCYVWLRSMTYGGEDTYTTVVYDGKIESLRLKSVALVRPAFTVPRDAKIEPYDGWVSGTQGFAFSCDKISDWK